jgi:hypothetical protein
MMLGMEQGYGLDRFGDMRRNIDFGAGQCHAAAKVWQYSGYCDLVRGSAVFTFKVLSLPQLLALICAATGQFLIVFGALFKRYGVTQLVLFKPWRGRWPRRHFGFLARMNTALLAGGIAVTRNSTPSLLASGHGRRIFRFIFRVFQAAHDLTRPLRIEPAGLPCPPFLAHETNSVPSPLLPKAQQTVQAPAAHCAF